MLQQHADGRWLGELDGQVGFFPARVTQVLPSPSLEDVVTTDNIAEGPAEAAAHAAKEADGLAAPAEPGFLVRALFPFAALATEELALVGGEFVQVIARDERGWAFGMTGDRSGWYA